MFDGAAKDERTGRRVVAKGTITLEALQQQAPIVNVDAVTLKRISTALLGRVAEHLTRLTTAGPAPPAFTVPRSCDTVDRLRSTTKAATPVCYQAGQRAVRIP
jgi:hypothetical protein